MAKAINDYVGDILKMKLSKCKLFPTSHGVDFLGYRHFPNGYILLRKSTVKRVKKRLKQLPYKMRHKIITADQARSSVASTQG